MSKKSKPIKIGNCTYGWRLVDGEWIENEAEQDVIRVIKELRSEGVSFRAIRDFLETQGIKRKEKKNG